MSAKWPRLTPQRGEHQVVHCPVMTCAAALVVKDGRVPQCPNCAKKGAKV